MTDDNLRCSAGVTSIKKNAWNSIVLCGPILLKELFLVLHLTNISFVIRGTTQHALMDKGSDENPLRLRRGVRKVDRSKSIQERLMR